MHDYWQVPVFKPHVCLSSRVHFGFKPQLWSNNLHQLSTLNIDICVLPLIAFSGIYIIGVAVLLLLAIGTDELFC